MVYRYLRIIALVLVSSGILILSLVPGGDNPPPFPYFDKVAHCIAYAVLSFLFMFAVYSRKSRFLKIGTLSVVCCSAYGGIIEILQGYTGRTPEAADLLADFSGSLFGVLLFSVILRVFFSMTRRMSVSEPDQDSSDNS